MAADMEKIEMILMENDERLEKTLNVFNDFKSDFSISENSPEE